MYSKYFQQMSNTWLSLTFQVSCIKSPKSKRKNDCTSSSHSAIAAGAARWQPDTSICNIKGEMNEEVEEEKEENEEKKEENEDILNSNI